MAGRVWSSMQYGSAVFVFITYVYMCYGCTPENGTDVLERAHYTQVLATGRVLKIMRGDYPYDTMYTAQVKVLCSYKGGPLPQTILIKEAGYKPDRHEPGLCISNQFEEGQEYLIFLRRNAAGELVPSHNEDLLDPQIVDDVPYFCGVEVMFPEGMTDPVEMERCPVPDDDYEYEDGDCIKYVEPTEPPRPDQPDRPDQPEVRTFKPGENGDQNNGNMDKDKNTPPSGKPEPNKPTDAGSVAQVESPGSGARMLGSLALLVACLSLTVL